MRSNDAFRLSLALGNGWIRDSLCRSAGENVKIRPGTDRAVMALGAARALKALRADGIKIYDMTVMRLIARAVETY